MDARGPAAVEGSPEQTTFVQQLLTEAHAIEAVNNGGAGSTASSSATAMSNSSTSSSSSDEAAQKKKYRVPKVRGRRRLDPGLKLSN